MASHSGRRQPSQPLRAHVIRRPRKAKHRSNRSLPVNAILRWFLPLDSFLSRQFENPDRTQAPHLRWLFECERTNSKNAWSPFELSFKPNGQTFGNIEICTVTYRWNESVKIKLETSNNTKQSCKQTTIVSKRYMMLLVLTWTSKLPPLKAKDFIQYLVLSPEAYIWRSPSPQIAEHFQVTLPFTKPSNIVHLLLLWCSNQEWEVHVEYDKQQ